MHLATDLSELPSGLRRSIHRLCADQNALAMMQARLRQTKIAKFYADNTPRSRDGIGERIAAIDPFFVSQLKLQFGHDIRSDNDFFKWVLKQEEMFRVKSSGTRIQSGWSPTPAWRKKYPEMKGPPEGETPNPQPSTLHPQLSA